MGIHEEAPACKLEKSSSPPPPPEQEQQQQTGVHVYPDWATMQAYYGPRMAMPPYFNPAVASPHGPLPYMWGHPQHMMPPPFAAFYPHGGVYAHPGVHLAASPPLNNDSPAKSSGDSDRGLMKKLKGVDGLAMSIGKANGGNDNVISNSGETEGTSEGSDGNTTEGGHQIGRKRSFERSTEVKKVEPQSGVSVASVRVLSPDPITELNLKNFPNTTALVPSEALLQNDRELKRERRKQSNRESARRSRLRKQAEAEELAVKVESLNGENLTLRSEINKLTENSEKLKLENVKLMERLKKQKDKESSLSTANLLSRVDNASGEIYESSKTSESGGKLRQLLDASPRTDAVVAG